VKASKAIWVGLGIAGLVGAGVALSARKARAAGDPTNFSRITSGLEAMSVAAGLGLGSKIVLAFSDKDHTQGVVGALKGVATEHPEDKLYFIDKKLLLELAKKHGLDVDEAYWGGVIALAGEESAYERYWKGNVVPATLRNNIATAAKEV
jgi:hypothetical protein